MNCIVENKITIYIKQDVNYLLGKILQLKFSKTKLK